MSQTKDLYTESNQIWQHIMAHDWSFMSTINVKTKLKATIKIEFLIWDQK